MSDSAVAQPESLVTTRDLGQIWILSLNRPERHNALVPEMLDEVREQLSLFYAEPASRVLVLAGAGPSFSTGGDVKGFATRSGGELRHYARRVVGALHDVVLDLLRLEKPVIAAIHGPVTGGSLGLVLASDIVVVGPKSWFQPYYTSVGFSPDGGWTALLPDRVGRSRARTWQLLNQRVDAAEALEVGLATHHAKDPLAYAIELAEEIASYKQGALERTKRLLAPDIDAVAARLDAELESFLEQIGTDEAARGMKEFLA